MSNEAEPLNRWELTETESRSLREFVTAIVLNGQVTAQASGLHPIDLYVLNILDLDGESTPGELAKRTALTTGAVTKLIDRLTRIGLVQRTADENDRRRVRLTIADGAESVVGESANLFAPMAKRMDDLISSFPEDRRAVIFDFFDLAAQELHNAMIELQGNRSRARKDPDSSQ